MNFEVIYQYQTCFCAVNNLYCLLIFQTVPAAKPPASSSSTQQQKSSSQVASSAAQKVKSSPSSIASIITKSQASTAVKPTVTRSPAPRTPTVKPVSKTNTTKPSSASSANMTTTAQANNATCNNISTTNAPVVSAQQPSSKEISDIDSRPSYAQMAKMAKERERERAKEGGSSSEPETSNDQTVNGPKEGAKEREGIHRERGALRDHQQTATRSPTRKDDYYKDRNAGPSNRGRVAKENRRGEYGYRPENRYRDNRKDSQARYAK